MKYQNWIIIFFLSSIITLSLLVFFLVIIHNYKVDRTLLEKEPLIGNNKKLEMLIGGDSAAKYGIIPEILSTKLNINNNSVFNLAGGNGDIISFFNLLKKNNIAGVNIIFSVSTYQINDGIKIDHYFPYAYMQEMGFFNLIEFLYPNNLDTLYLYFRKKIPYILFPFKKYPTLPDNNGYISLHGSLEDIEKFNFANIWYKDFKIDGFKFDLFKKYLFELKEHNKNVILFSGPYAPSYIEKYKNTNYIKFEIEFRNRINALSSDLEIQYLDYFNSILFNDGDFNDIIHLNHDGSKKLTEDIYKNINLNN